MELTFFFVGSILFYRKEGYFMNIRQLQYFVAVYNQKSFKHAAEYFSVSPQGINKMIKSLEDELEEKLFQRKGNTIVPTTAADELFPHALHLLEEFNFIESHYKQRRGKVTICSIDAIMDFYLLDFLTDFFVRHPDLDLKIIETTNDGAIEQLRRKECDFAILQENFRTAEIQNDFLFTSPFVILINTKNPISQQDIFTDKDFDKLRLAGRGCEYVIYDRTMKRLLSKNIHPINILESNNERLLVNLVKKNLAVATVNEAVAHHYKTKEMKILPIKDSSVNDQISISYYPNLSSDALLFYKELKNWVQTHLST